MPPLPLRSFRKGELMEAIYFPSSLPVKMVSFILNLRQLSSRSGAALRVAFLVSMSGELHSMLVFFAAEQGTNTVRLLSTALGSLFSFSVFSRLRVISGSFLKN